MAQDNPKASMDPNSSEADAEQLRLAQLQGMAYARALAHMTNSVAHDGGEQGPATT
jgi:hypothetical protein